MSRSLKSFLFTALLLFTSANLLATEETYSVRKSAEDINTDLSFEIIDGRYAELGLESFFDKSTQLIVKFGIQERSDYGYFADDATITADIKVQVLSPTGLPGEEFNQTLEINYSPEGGLQTNLSYMKLSGEHRYRVSVESLTLDGVLTLPDYVYLEAELTIDRFYELSLDEAPNLGFNFISYSSIDGAATYDYGLNKVATGTYGNPHEIEIYWSYIEGAQEYELEWTWIDNYGPIDLATKLAEDEVFFTERAFELNNTRVITPAQAYKIPIIYASGYLIYRVRAVGSWTDNDLQDVDKRIYGPWTTTDFSLSNEFTTIDNWPHYVIITNEHESEKNWQYQAVYAEEGKKKEIVSYFDGSLRNRQTVTRINSNNQAIVGENVYDNQGRSAIQILPTPVDNPALKYFGLLNLSTIGAGTNPYTHLDFDWDTGECISGAGAMDSTSGAANYYRVADGGETPQGNWQDYVPSSGGFPFVQVEYTPDNTGRIRRQSGVGETYTIDGEHATEYYYLQPLQEELNRLFGYHVGNAKHYKKNLVVDANGQVSISYIDPQGRVVATALAGGNDGETEETTKTNLISLDEHNDGTHLSATVDLLNKLNPADADTVLDNNHRYITGAHGVSVDALQVNTQHASVDDEQIHQFEYSVTTGTFSDDCMADGTAYPFAYDLNIDLKDDCGNNQFGFFDHDDDPATDEIQAGVSAVVGNIPGTNYVGSTGTSVTFNGDQLSALLETGGYSLSKLIKVNEDSLQKHLAHYMANLEPECIPNFLFDNADCEGEEYPDSLSVTDLDLSGCFIRSQTMLSDLMPYGQYAGLDPEDKTSIFNLENVLAQGEFDPTEDPALNWQNPFNPTAEPGKEHDYYDEDGDLSLVLTTYDGTVYTPEITDDGIAYLVAEHDADYPAGDYYILPKHLEHSEDFIANWEPDWANALITYHPEYPYLAYYQDFCEELGGPSVDLSPEETGVLISSEEFNILLQNITVFEDALSGGGYFSGDLLEDADLGTCKLKYYDPYFNINYAKINDTDPGENVNLFKENLMDEIFADYKDDGTPTDFTLWDYAVKIVLCGTDMTEDCVLPDTDPDGTALAALTDAQRDQIWNTYKQLYLTEKRKINQIFADVYAIRNGFYNGYIGQETPELPDLIGFSYYTPYFDAGTINILGLYEDAIAAAADGDFPWFTNDHVSLFATKVKRFEPIYGLYDVGVPIEDMAEDLEAEVEANIYTQTGQCPLLRDLEGFLKAMAENDLLQDAATVDSDAFPWLTEDLYGVDGMGGEETGTSPIIINTDITGSLLTIQVTNSQTGTYSITGGGTMKTITLEEPTAGYIDWTWDWDDITTMRMIYHAPGTSYNFKILAELQVMVLGELVYKEVVIDGSTLIELDNCYDVGDLDEPLCQKDENFANDIKALFTQLFDGVDLTATASTDAASLLGGWYVGSELFAQMGDNPEAPVTTISSTTNTITIYNVDLDRTFTADFGVIPPDIDVITGAIYNVEENVDTLYYISDLGDVEKFAATISIVVLDPITTPPSLIDLNCMCETELTTSVQMEDIFNTLIGMPNFDAADEGVEPVYVDVLSEIMEDAYLGDNIAVNKLNKSTIVEITFQGEIVDGIEDGCGLEIFSSGFDLSTLSSIYGLTVEEAEGAEDFTAYGFGIINIGGVNKIIPITIIGTAGSRCFKQLSCGCETPELLAPKSCTEQFAAYHGVIDVLNAALAPDNLDEVLPTFSTEDFCGTRLPWAVEAYIQYLTQMGITSNEDPDYISISAFGITGLNHFYVDKDLFGDPGYGIFDVVERYDAYVAAAIATTPPGEDTIYLNWNNYVNNIDLVENPICPPTPLPFYPTYEYEYPCEMYTANVDTINANNQMDIYLENLADNFKERYLEEAISSLVETFQVTYDDKEFHYTLYYYDQAGNLVQTVPPAGIDRLEAGTIDNDLIDNRRVNPDEDLTVPEQAALDLTTPDHSYRTQYHYNSLNQLVWQKTPDGGESYFGYDLLGRLVVSQNALQASKTNEQFSYTRYDELGRIIEVGEMSLETDYSFDQNGRFINATGTLVDVSNLSFPFNLGADLKRLEEVTRTQYDELFGISADAFQDYSADNTRNRITGVYYFETIYNGTSVTAPDEFDNATFYDYDVHGNVKELIQNINNEDLEDLDQDLKKVEYEYDLVSGNVKHVTYQQDQVDQFIHEYEYDADNRITNVRTSHDNVIWEQDAKYFYYNHGPLARTEIGDQKVQASDYAYTIQGWLKGVNSEDLTAAYDQGKDSHTGINKMNGIDVYGYSLHYFENDYTARHGNDFLALSDGALAHDHDLNLYNGNIKEMYTASTNTNEDYIGTSHTWYGYDQLNRIKSMDQEKLYDGTAQSRYASTYSFDANGNLDTLTRHAWDGTAKKLMDDFKYHYTLGTNQLRHVKDNSTEPYDFVVDLKSQDDDNYTYDEIGQLKADLQEDIAEIQWKVTGKVHKIIRETGSDKSNLEFVYDAMGNRIIKIETNNLGDLLKKTYYLRDAQGNVMSIYTLRHGISLPEDPAVFDLQLTERSIYGSSRVGTENISQTIASSDTSHVNIETGYVQTIGDKRFELSNHLGNVLEVVSDRKLQRETAEGSGVLDYYTADVVSQSDYFPFGMMLPNRNESSSEYRYGFNGMEKDDEVSGNANSYDFGARFYNPRVGRFLSIDPKEGIYPFVSPYCYAINSPLQFADENGEGPGDRIAKAESYMGTEYEQQTDLDLRTEETDAALEYMDCSELVCRVLAADGITVGVKSMNTSKLIEFFADDTKFEKSSTPKPGDIVLWNGHTAVVKSYDANARKQVTVVHATRYGSVESVVEESYSLDYYEGKGAYFYRPITENPDGGDAEADEESSGFQIDWTSVTSSDLEKLKKLLDLGGLSNVFELPVILPQKEATPKKFNNKRKKMQAEREAKRLEWEGRDKTPIEHIPQREVKRIETSITPASLN